MKGHFRLQHKARWAGIAKSHIMLACVGLIVLAQLVYTNQAGAQPFTGQISEARSHLVGAGFGNTIIFAGGSGYSDVVDIYNITTDTWSTDNLSEPKYELAGAATNSLIIFAGGYGNSGYSDAVDMYNSVTLTHTTDNLSVARSNLAGAASGYKVVFAGGLTSSGPSDVVDIYDTQTDTWTTATLSEPRYALTAVGLGGLIFIGGGYNGTSLSNVVDIYNTVTGEWTTATLSQGRSDLAAAASGTKIIFAGGHNGNTQSNVVDIYDILTGEWTTSTLSEARSQLAGAGAGDKILFAGGDTSTGHRSNVIDIYDTETGLWTSSTLSEARYALAGAAAGFEVMFAGGTGNGVKSNAFDAYNLNPTKPTDLVPGLITEPPVRLSWQQENGGDYVYDFELSAQSDFANVLRSETSITADSVELLSSDGIANNETYYWRVRARHLSEEWIVSDWASSSFEVQFHEDTPPPVLLIPERGSALEPPLVFTWEEEKQTGFRFNFHLSTKPDFSDTLQVSSLYVSTIEFAGIEQLDVNQTYYWRVRRQSDSFDEFVSDWAESSFKLQLDTPELISPEDAANAEPPVTFNWSGKKSGYHFKFHLSSQADFSDTLHYEGTLTDSVLVLDQSVSLAFGNNYHWRVRRVKSDNDSLISDWVSRSFVVDVEQPVLVGSGDGVAVELPDTLSWTEELKPDKYNFNVHISSTSDFSDTLRYEAAYGSNKLIITQSDSLELGNTYYWRVRRQGKMDQKLLSEWSSGEFTVTIEAPEITSPAAGGTYELPLLLNWTSGKTSGYRYHYHLSSSSKFLDTLRYYSSLTVRSINLPNLGFHSDSTYYWRVRKQGTINEDLISEWSESSFTIDVNTPVPVEPEDQASLALPVSLQWDYEYKQGYQLDVQVASDSEFTELVRDESYPWSTFGSPTTTIDLYNLPTNETYYWRVRRQSMSDPNLVSDWTTREFFVKPDFIRLSVDSAFTTLPNYVHAIFHATDQYGKGINTLTEEEFEAYNNESELIPQTGSESSYNVNRVDKIPTTTKVVMLLDNSTSLGQDLEQVKAAAIEFIRNKKDNQEVAVYTFSDGSQKIADFTSDTTTLIQLVNDIELGFNTTDLYGSLITMYDKWEDSFSLSQIDQGFLVVFSDGDDTAGRSSLSEALAARGSKQVFTVGFGSDVDPTILAQIGNAGSFYEQNDISRLTILFEEVQDDLTKLSESFYWFNFASPKRADAEFRVSLGVTGNTNFGADASFTILYNSSHFYSTKTQILVNSTAQNPDGINTLTVPADTTLDIEILSPYNYQVFPYSFNISDPSKLAIQPVSSGGNVFVYKVKANGSEGDQILVEITDNLTSALGAKTLTINFTAPNAAPVTPAVVTLNSPEDGSVNVSETPVIRWNRAENAFAYRLQISEASDFATVTLDTTLSDTLLTAPPLQSETTYYWRVQSTNRGLTADWSEVWSFTTTLSLPDAVVLTSPLGPQVETGGSIIFSWEDAGVNIEEYRFQLSNNGDFAAPLIDSLTSQTRLKLEGLTDATKYSWRVQAINAAGEGSFSDAATFNFVLVPGKPGIVNLLTPNDGASGLPLDLKFEWNQSELATHYQLQVASDSNFLTLQVDSTVTDTTLELSDFITETTYYWQVRALNSTDGVDGDWSATYRFTTEGEMTAPTEVTAEVTRTFGDAASPQDYRLVALPGEANESLASALGGTAGADWQAFWDNGADENFLVRYDGSTTFTLESGNGFWVTSKEAFEYTKTVNAVTLDAEKRTTISLHEGWNIISNPLDIDVDWSAVQSANGGGLQPLWGFEGSFSEPAGFTSAKGGEAFYFLNDQGIEELIIPYKKAAVKTKPDPDTRELRLITLTGEQETSSSRLVFVESNEQQPADVVAPPSGFEGVSLRFLPESMKKQSPRRSALARIYRELKVEGQTYKMRLSAEPAKTITIRLEGWDRSLAPEVALIDEQTGRRYDLTSKSGAEFTPEEQTTVFRLVIGDAAYVNSEQAGLLPSVVQVMHNFPNPFRGTTNLRFALPEQSRVRINVYDILGRLVATLLDEERPAGIHTIPYNASRHASGVYFSVFQIGDRRYIEKMMLIK